MALNEQEAKFYVYVVAVDGRIAYVGKGCGDRANIHLRRSHNAGLRALIDWARRAGKPVRVRKLAQNLTETEALRVERTLICRHRDRLTNASLGQLSPVERVIRGCKESLSKLKTREQILMEDRGFGEHRADLRDRIEREYRALMDLAVTQPHLFGRDGRIVITLAGAHG